MEKVAAAAPTVVGHKKKRRREHAVVDPSSWSSAAASAPSLQQDGDEEDEEDEEEGANTIRSARNKHPKKTTTRKVPPAAVIQRYGSHAYWEQRYETQFARLETNATTRATTSANDDDDDDDTPLPYHSWYFTYGELRPLLLPLLLGGRDEARNVLRIAADDDWDDDDDEEDYDCEESVDNNCSNHSKKTDIEDDSKEEVKDESQEQPSVEHDDDMSDDDNNNNSEEEEEYDGDAHKEVERDGLASNGPVSILELGCGDVPLGAALALELKELEETSHHSATNVVQQIVCTDYSQIVVEMMRKQYRRGGGGGGDSGKEKEDDEDAAVRGMVDEKKIEDTPETAEGDDPATTVKAPASSKSASTDPMISVDVGSVPLEFDTVDARQLPYEAERFALVMEKGTLDAVLSDTVHGARDCVTIVSECARVVAVGGCILLISHLNAHTANGMSWLEEVVFSGLKEGGGGSVDWEIEVHGHDEEPTDEEGGEDDDDDNSDDDDSGKATSRFPPNSAGPAVYIIHKKKRVAPPTSLKEETEANEDISEAQSTIPVRFFTY